MSVRIVKSSEVEALSEARYRSYFEHAPDGVLLVDVTGKVLEANLAACALLGYSSDEFSKLTLWQTIAPRALDVARAHFGQVTSAGRACGDVPLIRKDRTALVAEINAVALGPDRFIGFLRDVTRHREAEHANALYAQAFESSGEAVLITDAQNCIVSVNPAFTRITGYTLDEVRGKNPRLLSSGRHGPSFYAAMWGALQNLGTWQGEVWNRRKNGEVYVEWATLSQVVRQGELLSYVAVFSDITARRAAEAEVSYAAHHDALTQLANRSLLDDRLSQSLSAARSLGTQVALLCLDLDEFKTINDSLGHRSGDIYLQSVAARLKGCTRTSDTVARMGGDEFALVLTGLKDAAQDASQVAQKVLQALAVPHLVNGQEISGGASIGIALFPQDGQEAQSLTSNADAAMYSARANGRNTWQFFRREMTTHANERLELENKLRRAVGLGHVRLEYQPQIDLRSSKLVGVEALLRWTDPDLGPVSPARFIPIAEDSGLIVALGEWVLRTAAAQQRHWVGLGLPPFSVSVNVSAAQFHQRDFVDLVRRVMQDTEGGLQLELEVTESVVMRDALGAISCLGALRDMGVTLAMDDFGIGYSSLGYLKRFPIDRLKIDQSFVRDLTSAREDLEIVRAIVAMGHALGLVVLAEGVERPDQLELLRREGCDQVQGWYYSRAVPAAAIEELVLTAPSSWAGPAAARAASTG